MFTGIEKFIDTEGRIEKFQKRASQKIDLKKKEVVQKAEPQKSLKEMLQDVRNATKE